MGLSGLLESTALGLLVGHEFPESRRIFISPLEIQEAFAQIRLAIGEVPILAAEQVCLSAKNLELDLSCRSDC